MYAVGQSIVLKLNVCIILKNLDKLWLACFWCWYSYIALQGNLSNVLHVRFEQIKILMFLTLILIEIQFLIKTILKTFFQRKFLFISPDQSLILFGYSIKLLLTKINRSTIGFFCIPFKFYQNI